MRFTATAYCDRGETQSGTQVRHGIIAADPRVLPMGSVVRIEGVGVRPGNYVVSDTGAAVKGRRLDIFMSSCAAAKRFGRRAVTARLIKTAANDRPVP